MPSVINAGSTTKLFPTAVPHLGDRATHALHNHYWPGNVRELRHAIERAMVLCRGNVLDEEHLSLTRIVPSSSQKAVTKASPGRMRERIHDFERNQILAALAATGGNQTKAAALLGFSRRTLTNKLTAYGVERPRKSHLSFVSDEPSAPLARSC